MENEYNQILDVENKINLMKNDMKQLQLKYILTKKKLSDFDKNKIENIVINENKNKFNKLKIIELSNTKKDVMDSMNKLKEILIEHKSVEDKNLEEELNIFKMEVDRIRLKKNDIEQNLQIELSNLVKDMELIDKKIENKIRIINLLHNMWESKRFYR